MAAIFASRVVRRGCVIVTSLESDRGLVDERTGCTQADTGWWQAVVSAWFPVRWFRSIPFHPPARKGEPLRGPLCVCTRGGALYWTAFFASVIPCRSCSSRLRSDPISVCRLVSRSSPGPGASVCGLPGLSASHALEESGQIAPAVWRCLMVEDFVSFSTIPSRRDQTPQFHPSGAG